MRRTLGGLVLTAALAVLVSAVWDHEAYTAGAARAERDLEAGGVQNQVGVQFKIKFRNGKPRTIKRFRFRDLPTPCAQGVILVRGKKLGMRINRRKRFSGLVRNDEGGRARITGEVRRRGRKVVGIVRARGTFRGPPHEFGGNVYTNCDSGRRDWRATGPKRIWLGGG